MPTYEYRCKDCAHQFDVQQAFTDDALTECPNCGGALKKVFGNVGITFKGSGFYKTDSRGSSSATTPPASSDSSKSDSSKSDSGSSNSGSDSSSTAAGTPAKSSETSSSSTTASTTSP